MADWVLWEPHAMNFREPFFGRPKRFIKLMTKWNVFFFLRKQRWTYRCAFKMDTVLGISNAITTPVLQGS